MSFFQKSKIELKKTLHHHFFSVRLRHFRGLTFMLLFLFGGVVTCRPLCCGLRGCSIGGRMVRRMVRWMGEPFLQILGWLVSGDDLNNPNRRDGAESFATERWSDGWGSRFGGFLDDRFWGMFWIFWIFWIFGYFGYFDKIGLGKNNIFSY